MTESRFNPDHVERCNYCHQPLRAVPPQPTRGAPPEPETIANARRRLDSAVSAMEPDNDLWALYEKARDGLAASVKRHAQSLSVDPEAVTKGPTQQDAFDEGFLFGWHSAKSGSSDIEAQRRLHWKTSSTLRAALAAVVPKQEDSGVSTPPDFYRQINNRLDALERRSPDG